MEKQRVYELLNYYLMSKKATESILEQTNDVEYQNTAKVGLQIFDDTIEVFKLVLLGKDVINQLDGDESAE